MYSLINKFPNSISIFFRMWKICERIGYWTLTSTTYLDLSFGTRIYTREMEDVITNIFTQCEMVHKAKNDRWSNVWLVYNCSIPSVCWTGLSLVLVVIVFHTSASLYRIDGNILTIDYYNLLISQIKIYFLTLLKLLVFVFFTTIGTYKNWLRLMWALPVSSISHSVGSTPGEIQWVNKRSHI